MFKSLFTKTTESMDLNMYCCGKQECEPGHDFGPAVRDHYLIHYIFEGEGIFSVDGNTYRLGQGQGFLIYPDIVTYYKADMVNPWVYAWVGFKGLKAFHYLKLAGLSRENPIFSYNTDSYLKDCLNEMVESNHTASSQDLKLTGLLYMFISRLVEMNGSNIAADNPVMDRSDYYVNQAIRCMEINYSRNISISEIAASIGLDRSYLGSLFKKKLNVSPQEYLLKLRIEKACQLMVNENLTIGDISRSVGYGDQLHFSKMFKKIKHVSPTEYRKRLLESRASGCGCI